MVVSYYTVDTHACIQLTYNSHGDPLLDAHAPHACEGAETCHYVEQHGGPHHAKHVKHESLDRQQLQIKGRIYMYMYMYTGLVVQLCIFT